VSVVLSGTGANGSMGMKRVKERGGLCIVQDPEEAEYDDMPRNSLATGLVDYVLPVAEIPKRIIAYREQLKLIQVSDEPPEQNEVDANALRDIFTQLRVRTGHDFSNYKRPTVMRRIARRIGVNNLPNLAAYSQFMHDRPEEANALLKDLLISVTNFFRDAEALEELEREIVPKLFAGKTAEDQVRVWVVGCATGEEAYTIAMILYDYAANLASPPQIQIFATDIDEDAIATARDGFYNLSEAADVPIERLTQHFVRVETGGYRVRPEIRERVLFAVHNIIKDPPFAHLDLAMCRNLLIYLNSTAQRRVLEVLHFAVSPAGYLMLGASESIDGAADLYSLINKEQRIYQGRAVETRLMFPAPDTMWSTRLGTLPRIPRMPASHAAPRVTYAQLHHRLLEHYAAPSVVINEDYDILHLSDNAGQFMQIKGGEPSNNLLLLVRPELRLELRSALYQARHNKAEVKSRAVSIQNGSRTISLRVKPVLNEEDSARGFFLVLFEQAAESPPEDHAEPIVTSDNEDPFARRLEEELLEVREQLTATLEQHELQREELKASNEELEAMNEEMRAAAEELETSKEELQSINEELTTVNQELKIKIDELGHTNDDLRNLMNSTRIGTVFLDREMRIKLFTPRVRDVFNLIPADVGRGLSDITSNLDDDRLIEDAQTVLESLQGIERAVRTKDGHTFLMQISPYRTTEDRIDGVVVAFTDITDRDRAEQAVRQSEEQFRRSIEDAPIPMIMQAEDGEVLQISRTWTELTGYTRNDVRNFESWLTQAYGEGAEQVRNHVHEIFKGERKTLNVEFPIHTRAGKVRRWSFSASSPGTLRDGRRFIVGMASDITDRKQAEDALRKFNEGGRLMMETIEDYAVITSDVEGRIETWSVGAERFFGYPEEEAIGQSGSIIFTPEDREKGADLQEMQTAREVGRASDERWHLRKDGTRVYVSGALYAMRDADGTLTGYTKIARDLTERVRAEEELRRAHDELEVRVRERTFELAKANESLRDEISERMRTEKERFRLLRQIVRAQEDERRRIARDIHDHLGQQMTALRLNLAGLDETYGNDEEAGRKLEQTKAIAERLDADVDFLAWELRPAALDDIGLAEAVSNYVTQWSKHSGVEAQFHTTGMENERLSPETETNLYRIAQEALNNTLKYAQAKRADVLLERRGEHVVLIVEDDGVGFDPKLAETDQGLGLIGMRERAVLVGGSLEIESKPNQGTTIFARVPVRSLEEEADKAK
jgi:two-component system CheB/CheR fusion protein